MHGHREAPPPNDAVMANVDRHSGNYGFLVDNATGRVLRMAPLLDHNAPIR